jgi:hypothetical protein
LRFDTINRVWESGKERERERERETKETSESGGGYVRADQIDLKSLDEQLQRHLSRAWTMEKNKNREQEQEATPTVTRHEWEIDPSKLIIKGVIARGTFGTVHRGIYDGQDVAGIGFFFLFLFLFCSVNFHLGK